MPKHAKAAIWDRQITAGRPDWVLIENEGALFRGPARNVPMEVWRERKMEWEPYTDPRGPKPYEWGYDISEDEARHLVEIWAVEASQGPFSR